MTTQLALRAGSADRLTRYVAVQLHSMFPDATLDDDMERIARAMPNALERMRPVLAAVRIFEHDRFDHLHSLQYCSLLYLLSNEYRRISLTDGVCDRLFGLNRALNAIDLYHAVEMPEVFFVSHGLGSVLGAASYRSRLVFFQHVTVGRVGEDRPDIGSGVVLFPGCSVTGRSVIGDGCVVAAGVQVHDEIIPRDSLVFASGRSTVAVPRKRDILGLYLRAA